MKRSLMWWLARPSFVVRIGAACLRLTAQDVTVRPWNTSSKSNSPPKGRLLDAIPSKTLRAACGASLNTGLKRPLRVASILIGSAPTGVLGFGKRFLIPVHACGNRRCIHDAPPTSVEGSKADCPRVRGGAYLVRFQTTVAVPPPDAAGTVYCSSSPVTVNTRFCSVPSQLGNVAVSILKVMVLSAALTDTVPKWAPLPWTIALFSSGVAVVRL